MRKVTWLVVALGFLLGPAPATSQELGFLTGAFKNVHSVTIGFLAGDLTDKRDLATNDSGCDILNVCGIAAEILFDVTAPTKGMHLELGVGASYMRGFHEKPESAYDIRGSVRSFPTVSAYATWEGSPIEPYAGVSFGFSELWNVQAYNAAGTEFSVKSQTFDWGATVGFFKPIGTTVGVFLEANYRRRRFAGLDWSTDTLASRPRELNLDALVGSVGFQFDIREPKPKPPAFEGTWVLDKLDGQALPVVWTATAAGGASGRVELLSGSLDMSGSAFTLHLWERTAQYQGDDLVTAAAPRKLKEIVGTVQAQNGVLLLTPRDTTDPTMQVRRTGNEIIMRYAGHVLTFSRIGSAIPNAPF
jgi:hypothetical protein